MNIITNIIYFITKQNINIVLSLIGKMNTLITTINVNNFLNVYNQIDPIKNNYSWYNRLLRYFIAKKPTYLHILDKKDYLYIYDTLTIADLSFIIFNSYRYFFNKSLIFLNLNKKWSCNIAPEKAGEINDQDRQNYINYLIKDIDKPQNYPDNLITFKGIDWFVNYGLYCFDLIERECEYFIIDTTFMNNFEMKEDCDNIGCKAYFNLTTDGFELIKIQYNCKIYNRSDTSDNNIYTALYALYASIITYVTIGSHFTQSHYLISTRITQLNRRLLDENHPIRKILLPTEFNTLQVMKNALLSLITDDSNSNLYYMFNFTDNGIKEIIKDYINKYKYDSINYVGDNFMSKLKLTDKELTYKPINSYYKWYNIIKTFSYDFTNNLSETEINQLNDWIIAVYPDSKLEKKIIIQRIIGGMYYEQIKHKMMSNPSLLYYVPKHIPILQKDKNNKYYYTLLNQYISISTLNATQLTLPEITMDLSFLIDNDKLKKIYKKFYDDINTLDLSWLCEDIQLIKPDDIDISTGV